MALDKKAEARKIRKARIRKNITGKTTRPRLSVFRSATFTYAQIIDDKDGKTLVSCSSAEKDLRKSLKSPRNLEAAKLVGSTLAKRALSKKIAEVVFDRNGFFFHGRIKAIAEGAREGGLKF